MSRSVTLPTEFVLCHTAVGTDRADLPPLNSERWLPAVVPGGVHESLLAAGRIPHPYRDQNEQGVRWIEDRDWWFRSAFAEPSGVAAGERVRLVCHGLDTVADLWLNGEPLGHHENMFRPAEFNVTGRLAEHNELLVRFSPPLAGLEAPAEVLELFRRLGGLFAELATEPAAESEGGAPAQPESEGLMSASLPLATLRRKATFSWGWDFGPRLPSVGVWRPVELVCDTEAVLTGHHLYTETVVDGVAVVGVRVEAEALTVAEGLRARVVLTSPSGTVSRVELPVVGGPDGLVASGTLRVPDAQLWWTHDLGEPALYDAAITLLSGDRPLDERTDRIGLRTVRLDRSPDPEGGRLFRFVLNGVPVFARGAAWLPASTMVGSVTEARYRSLLELAQGGGMNMLRIWGGGVYEHDSFYGICDELGVMVWHDFMFACTDYPSHDPGLRREVELEAAYQVRRLRNRACMALWCGNNEVQLIHGFAYQDYEPGNWGWDFFYRVLPETVARHDGAVPYWPGSPWGEAPEEGFMAANGVMDGDRHAWEVWHGFDFGAGGGDFASVGEARHYRRYAQDRGKFISEFGIHASPELSTLRRWLAPEQLVVHSPTFDHHNKDNPKNKGDALLEIVTGLPASIEEYVDFTMVSQAEGMKFGIEHYRRRQPHCSGALVWQFNDVWPGFSWSLVDFDAVPKAGYYFARRAFAPLLASFRRDGSRLELWVSNSGRRDRDVTAEVSLGRFSGTQELRETVSATVAAGTSRRVWSVEGDAAAFGAERFARVASPTGQFPANRLFFTEIKDLAWGDAELNTSVRDLGGGRAAVELESRGFSYLVRVASPAPGVRFSDNYLELRHGERRAVQITGLPRGFDVQTLEVGSYLGARTAG